MIVGLCVLTGFLLFFDWYDHEKSITLHSVCY